MTEIQVGLGRSDLWGSWQTAQLLVDQIDVRAMAVVRPETAAAMVAADVCGMWPATCQRLRRAVADALATSATQVGVFCTQNHGAPMEGPGI